jgi:sulfatase maturation enzyme AslB (radical SAM superfamily)
MTIPAPKFLFLPVYDACNLRCPHCAFWKRPHTLKQTSWADGDHKTRRWTIMEEFASLNPIGTVVTHEGESLLDWSGYLELSRRARALGLRLLTVTNGTMIYSSERAGELVIDGPSEINISLDSVKPEIHDKFRGVKGSFDKAVRALQLLIAARREWRSDIKVNTILLVGKSTYEDLDASYDFALNALGVDKLKLNAIQPSFGNDSGDDPFFAEESDVDPGRLRAALLEVNSKYKLSFDPRWISLMTMYFKSLREYSSENKLLGWQGDLITQDHICNSYDRNIWVSERSDMFLCCDSSWPGAVWEKPGDMKRFWEGVGELRGKMGACNRLCGVSHSLRNTSATVK